MTTPIKVEIPRKQRGCGTCAKFRAMLPSRIARPLEDLEQRRLARKAAKAQRKQLAARLKSAME